jgi:hypothetical protein
LGKISSELQNWKSEPFLASGPIAQGTANSINIQKLLDLLRARSCAAKFQEDAVLDEIEWNTKVWRRVLEINDKTPSDLEGGWLCG